MASGRQIAALLIAVTVAGAMLPAVFSSLSDNSGTVQVENETLTASLNESNDLRGYNVDSGTVVVEYDTGSGYQTATQGTDYTVDRDGGAITPLGNGNISAGDPLRVDYTYQATSGSTTTIVQLIPLFVALIIMVAMYAKMQEMM
jgi:type II secretory pathway pseudopilin PulG